MDGNKLTDEKVQSVKQAGISTTSKHRRILLKGAPSLLLLANRPAFAGTCTISGFTSASMGTSLTNYDPTMCNGWSPQSWTDTRGQIKQEPWDVASVSRHQSFSSVFNSANMTVNCGIREVVDDVPGSLIDYSSGIAFTMQQVLEGAVQGTNEATIVVKHAAASCLNASFIANGGGGSKPDPWMDNYIDPLDVLGFYLLYERLYLSTLPVPPGATYRYERNGGVIADSQYMSTTYYRDFFLSMSDGKASKGWKKGYY